MEHPLSQFKYCPKCGSEHFNIHNEKSKQCTNCGFVYYFNPSSATVALILNKKNELLVCRRAKDPAKGTLDLPGGFIDMDETAEEGVAREVLEETGLKVKEAIYRFTLPNIYVYSGFPVHTLDMFFLCKVEDTSHIAAMDDAADAFFIPGCRDPSRRLRARLYPQRSWNFPIYSVTPANRSSSIFFSWGFPTVPSFIQGFPSIGQNNKFGIVRMEKADSKRGSLSTSTL